MKKMPQPQRGGVSWLAVEFPYSANSRRQSGVDMQFRIIVTLHCTVKAVQHCHLAARGVVGSILTLGDIRLIDNWKLAVRA